MAMEPLSDERKTYVAIQAIIDAMLEFDQDTRARMLRTVATFFGIDSVLPFGGPSKPPQTHEDGVSTFSNREELSPKDFLLQKKPRTDVERVACLAFYLTHYRNIAHFKTMDISKLNTDAAQIKFSNASYAVNNAMRSGFIVAAVRGTKQLSAPGEKFVDHLPDYAMATKVMSELRPRRRKKTAIKDMTSASANNGMSKNE